MENSEIEIRKLNYSTVLKSLLFIFAIFSICIAVMIDPTLFKTTIKLDGYWFVRFNTLLKSEMQPVSLMSVLSIFLCGFLLWTEVFKTDKPFSITAAVVGFIFALFSILGKSFSQFNSFEFLIANGTQIVISSIAFIGYTILYYCIISKLLSFIDAKAICPKRIQYEGVLRVINEDFFRISFELMFIVWICFSLFYYPGSLGHDTRNQLLQYYQLKRFDTQHPIFSSLLFGVIFDSGNFLLGNYGGIRLCIFTQAILGAYVFSKIAEYIKNRTQRVFWGVIAFAFFAFVPTFWVYIQSAVKDTFYFIIFAFVSLKLVIILYDKPTVSDYISFFCSGIILTLLRSNGIFILFPMLIIIGIKTWKQKKIFCFLALVSFVISIMTPICLNKVYKINKNTNPDVLVARSIQLQQIARYVKFYENELSENEKKVIDDILIINDLGSRYNPEISDRVKFKHRDTSKITDKQWKAFNHLWIKLGLRKPGLYIESVINNMFGYTHLFDRELSFPHCFYIKENILGFTDLEVNYAEYYFPEDIRSIGKELAYIWGLFPILSFFINPAFPTIIGIFLIACLLRKKKFKYLIYFIAPFLNVLICFASPVNGYLRYALPVFAALPLYMLVGLLPCIEGGEELLLSGEKKNG